MQLKPIEWTEEKLNDTVSELTGKTGLGDFVVAKWKNDYSLEKTPWDPEGAGLLITFFGIVVFGCLIALVANAA